ncbi:hypothetical protein [Kitasatospora sp. NPDC088351]|uniref:hypothetical protein n=1 Tax=unclassified Kitasatospora TaxID=2633591 RepID=UPI003448C126
MTRNPSVTHRALAALAGCAALAAVVTGCGSGDADRTAAPPLGPVPVITEPGQITLPIDAYELTDAQRLQLARAVDAAVDQCMRGYGLRGRSNTPTAVTVTGLPDPGPRARDGLYGFFNPATGGRNGYESRTHTEPLMPDDDTPATEAEELALTGAVRGGRPENAHVSNKAVPAGGCREEGRAAVDADDLLRGSRLPDGGPQVPSNDPRITEAHATWSTCMQGKGYSYADPFAAMTDPKWRAGNPTVDTPIGPDEIATATADLECKLTGNTVGVVTAVQAAYDRRYIDSHAQQLAARAQRLDEALRKAARLAGGS